jgi:hypothetical protein
MLWMKRARRLNASFFRANKKLLSRCDELKFSEPIMNAGYAIPVKRLCRNSKEYHSVSSADGGVTQ